MASAAIATANEQGREFHLFIERSRDNFVAPRAPDLPEVVE